MSGAFDKMVSLISSTEFVSVETAERQIDWEKTATIKLP